MKKISIKIFGHETSISLEKEFIDAAKKIASEKNISLQKLIEKIDFKKPEKQNLSSAIRVFILKEHM